MGIRIKDQFPASRRQDPKRRAEARVYDALTRLEFDGHGLYEFRYRDGGQQVDFPVWVHGIGRYAIEVKGGQYEMPAPGEWALLQPDGSRLAVPSPVDEAADGGLEMRSAIHEATTFRNFVAAVLLFPDMERVARIERAARNARSVYTIWGLEQLEEDLERIAGLAAFRRPPLSRISANECDKLHELQYGGPAPSVPEEGMDDFASRPVVIQHVEHLHIHASALEGVPPLDIAASLPRMAGNGVVGPQAYFFPEGPAPPFCAILRGGGAGFWEGFHWNLPE